MYHRAGSYTAKLGGAFSNLVEDATAKALTLPKWYLSEPVVRYLAPLLCAANATIEDKRAKPHVLILRNKFYARDSRQPSTEEMHLDNTLSASGLATFEALTYDHDLMISPLADLQLLRKCESEKPDVVILSSWGEAPRHPSIASLRYIRRELKIPVVSIWWDTCNTKFWKDVQSIVAEIDCHVVVDNPRRLLADALENENDSFLWLWVPEDSSLYSAGGEKDIPVSFLGQASAYRAYRSEFVDHLISSGIAGYFSTADRHSQVSHREYASILRRSLMSINLSYSVSCHQLKSRVFEIMLSGSLLLESENPQISALFEPMTHYVPFSSKQDLCDKVRHYIAHPEEARQIAKNGLDRAASCYNGDLFWRMVLNKAGVAVP
jgi:hypothetical protein